MCILFRSFCWLSFSGLWFFFCVVSQPCTSLFVIIFYLQVQHWLNQLCEELNERLNSDLNQNKRIAQTLTLHARAYKVGLLWLVFTWFSFTLKICSFFTFSHILFPTFLLSSSMVLFYVYFVWAFILQTGDSDSLRKFPSKSCPLRYGTRKIQEDALILFQAGLREFSDSYSFKVHGNENSNWGVTSLSVSASKIVSIPSVS